MWVLDCDRSHAREAAAARPGEADAEFPWFAPRQRRRQRPRGSPFEAGAGLTSAQRRFERRRSRTGGQRAADPASGR